ncbi:uncharacterized protein LAESUDRAFT_759010 [Laetiporus sulphureus 93-53]|uniref:Uncharacterized protein n=1 Tax=Laetiporus sulphureus 93-53 TaxID=1314785 RepID=A0A165EDZ8_9APHY|nr:uncharacterized protein LAESUDRAFT_759010 [Laetiporus sulphureus 93-53]KZT06835.1 hypothetical protein LAESUDRAFT_759010 [Laetiporus sulphureus 93-53]
MAEGTSAPVINNKPISRRQPTSASPTIPWDAWDTWKRVRTSSPEPQPHGWTLRERQSTEGRAMPTLGLLTPVPSHRSEADGTTENNEDSSYATAAESLGEGKGKARAREGDSPNIAAAPCDTGGGRAHESHPSTHADLVGPPLGGADPASFDPEVSVESLMEEETEWEEEQSGSEASFYLLDVPDVASLNGLATETFSFANSSFKGSTSLYLPPGVRQLVEGMRGTLKLERKARRRAEKRLAEEVERRITAERNATQLAHQNRFLESETRIWASATADTFASQIVDRLTILHELDPGIASQADQGPPADEAGISERSLSALLAGPGTHADMVLDSIEEMLA